MKCRHLDTLRRKTVEHKRKEILKSGKKKKDRLPTNQLFERIVTLKVEVNGMILPKG